MSECQNNMIHNIQPRAGGNMWYDRLAERYNFTLGSTILPLLTTENLTTLESLDPLYLKELLELLGTGI